MALLVAVPLGMALHRREQRTRMRSAAERQLAESQKMEAIALGRGVPTTSTTC
jgi:hypothetical protein